MNISGLSSKCSEAPAECSYELDSHKWGTSFKHDKFQVYGKRKEQLKKV
jgi:hypothetical protein